MSDLLKPMTSFNILSRETAMKFDLNIFTYVCRSGLARKAVVESSESFPGRQEAVPQARQQHRVFLEILCLNKHSCTYMLLHSWVFSCALCVILNTRAQTLWAWCTKFAKNIFMFVGKIDDYLFVHTCCWALM